MAVRHLLLPGVVALIACGSDAGQGRAAGTTVATVAIDGRGIFNAQCALCHGRGGDKSIGGAKLLHVSTLPREGMVAVVTNGRGAMMPYKGTLTAEEIQAVVDHAMGLRTKKE